MKTLLMILAFSVVAVAQADYPRTDVNYAAEGIIATTIGDYRLAIQHFSTAIRIKEKSLYYEFRGQAKLKIEDYSGAISDYSDSIRLCDFRDTSCFKLYQSRGEAEYHNKDYKDALADIDRFLDSKPNTWSDNRYLLDTTGQRRKADLARTYFLRGMSKLSLNDSGDWYADFSKSCELGDSTGCLWVYAHERMADVRKRKSPRASTQSSTSNLAGTEWTIEDVLPAWPPVFVRYFLKFTDENKVVYKSFVTQGSISLKLGLNPAFDRHSTELNSDLTRNIAPYAIVTDGAEGTYTRNGDTVTLDFPGAIWTFTIKNNSVMNGTMTYKNPNATVKERPFGLEKISAQ